MFDVRKKPLKAGQTIAVAFRDGNLAILRIGKILELHEREQKVTIKWQSGGVYTPTVSTLSVDGQFVPRPRLAVIEE